MTTNRFQCIWELAPDNWVIREKSSLVAVARCSSEENARMVTRLMNIGHRQDQ